MTSHKNPLHIAHGLVGMYLMNAQHGSYLDVDDQSWSTSPPRAWLRFLFRFLACTEMTDLLTGRPSLHAAAWSQGRLRLLSGDYWMAVRPLQLAGVLVLKVST